jgi:nucleotide-binding universal stress UspA family protein
LQRKGLRLNLKKPILIVVPTDLGENSKCAEAYALTLAERLKAEVLFVHGLYDSAYPFLQGDFSNPGSYDRGDWFALLSKEANAALARKKRAAEARGIRCQVVLESRFISITRAVLSRCPSHHAIVVVGTHAKSRFRHAFLGSTARELIAASPVPVITVASKR